MKRHHEAETQPRMFQYHTQSPDGIVWPIRFAFVTEAMCDSIQAERALILALTPSTQQAKQEEALATYDPAQSARVFAGILDLFAPRG